MEKKILSTVRYMCSYYGDSRVALIVSYEHPHISTILGELKKLESYKRDPSKIEITIMGIEFSTVYDLED